MTTPTSDFQDVLIRRDGRAGRITLNRPKALNALTTAMVRAIMPALQAWTLDDSVELVLLDGAGDRALCAGGDVRSLYDSRGEGSGEARTFWREEYAVNALIGRYPKPFVSFMDGIVMGGGIGLSAHSSHRIVTERSALAMPETTIGLIPDVGGTWLLVHAPGASGVYLGLTGERMGAADAIYARFADTFVPSQKLGALAAALCSERQAPETIIAKFADDPGPSGLARLQGDIDRAFGQPSVEAIDAVLVEMGGPWAEKCRAAFGVRSPLAMKATLAAIVNARSLKGLEAALNMEFRLCTRLFEAGEFPEGVRALLVDKDKAPKWRYPRLANVTEAALAEIFAPLPAGEELTLE